ncbi:MAG: hypothetical protein NTY02_14460, partial [Acidobacteria bacterium]|nr:hypothetical protein [Acidobacteriota bacterium]
WVESATTGLGRVPAADVATTMAAITRDRGPLTIDRAGGGLIAWPNGQLPYFAGGYVYEDLANATSQERVGTLLDKPARRLPYTGTTAFHGVFNREAIDVWRETASLRSHSGEAMPSRVRRVSADGFTVTAPRFTSSATSGGTRNQPESLVYTSSGPHRFPDIRRVDLRTGRTTRVVTRVAGDAITVSGDWIYFDQIEFAGAVSRYADLYAANLVSGRTVRRSHGQRLSDADISPRGDTMVAVRSSLGRRELGVWPVTRAADGSPTLADAPSRVVQQPDCAFATPRWSPDASRIVAVRHCSGELPGTRHLRLAT